jgi:hypothetical protein
VVEKSTPVGPVHMAMDLSHARRLLAPQSDTSNPLGQFIQENQPKEFGDKVENVFGRQHGSIVALCARCVKTGKTGCNSPPVCSCLANSSLLFKRAVSG